MNLEERIVKLEKSNKNYKIVIALCLCMFMVSAKDIFIKDEIKAKVIYADTLKAKWIESDIGLYNNCVIVGDTTFVKGEGRESTRICSDEIITDHIYLKFMHAELIDCDFCHNPKKYSDKYK